MILISSQITVIRVETHDIRSVLSEQDQLRTSVLNVAQVSSCSMETVFQLVQMDSMKMMWPTNVNLVMNGDRSAMAQPDLNEQLATHFTII